MTRTNQKIFLKKFSTFPGIFHEKLTTFSGKILQFFVENWLIFTVKFNGAYSEIRFVKCSCKDRHIFLQKSADFPVKTVKIDLYMSPTYLKNDNFFSSVWTQRKQDFVLTGAIIKWEGNLNETIWTIKQRSV